MKEVNVEEVRETIFQLNLRLGLTCKDHDCSAVRMAAISNEPAVVYYNKKELATIGHPTMPDPSGLCYYHLKKKHGFIK